jgi:purine-binding chemotaxis protein CheW
LTSTFSATDRARLPALAVRIAGKLHAIPIGAVEEVLPALPVEELPQCPPYVRGVVFVRGHLIPVLSAAERLELRGYERPPEPYIVCLSLGGQLLGIEVDEALDLIDLAGGSELAAERVGAGGGFFDRVLELDGQIVRVLNPDRLLDREEAAQLGQLRD